MDTVDIQVLANTQLRYHVRLQNRSDGTGESSVIKVDKSTLTGPLAGLEPGRLVLEEAQCSMQGFTSVRLDWDHTTDDELITFGGPFFNNWESTGGIVDPNTAGGTGDVLLTTVGAVSGATYDITLKFRKKQ